MIFSESSSAAWRPMSGLLPAPSPFVSLAPIWILSGARDPLRAWQSVLATMNSTPCRLVEIIRFTALLPPPPTPITLMLAPTALFSSKDNLNAAFESFSSIRIMRVSSKRVRSASLSPCRPCGPGGRDGAVSAACSRGAARRKGSAPRPCCAAVSRRHRRAPRDRRASPGAPARSGSARPSPGSLEHRPAAGQDDTGVEGAVEGAAHELLGDQGEDLLDPGLDDLAQERTRQDARLASADRRHLDGVLLADERGQGAAVLPLDPLGFRNRSAQTDGDVVRDVLSARGQRRDVPDGATLEDDQIARPGADVDEGDAHLLLVGAQDRVGGRELLEDDLLDLDAGAVDAVDQVLRRGHGGGDDVHVRLQLRAGHADRVVNAVLVVHHEFLRKDVEDLALRRAVHRTRRG